MKTELNSLHVAPLTNRGVVNASGPILRQFLLFDWIQVTIFPFKSKDIENVDEFFQRKIEDIFQGSSDNVRFNDYYDIFWYLFRIDRTRVLFNVETPIRPYTFCYSYKNIKILGNDEHPEFGVHILLSGTACREFEDLGLTYDELFYKLKDFRPHYTRIDVSFDDYTGDYWTLDRVANCIRNVEVVTRFRSSIQIKKEDLISLDNIGHTIQFGSRASDIQFTFYDKLKERRCNSVLVDESITHWNRFETRFRNDKALAIVNHYLYFSDKVNCIASVDLHIDCESFNDYVKSIINNYISFRVRSATDKTRSRWSYQKWWSDFLDNCKKIPFQNRPIEYSITKKKQWIDKSVSFSNFCVFIADLPDITKDELSSRYLYNLFMTGAEKLTSKELQYINEYRISKGLNVFTLEEIESYVDSVKEFLVVKNGSN